MCNYHFNKIIFFLVTIVVTTRDMDYIRGICYMRIQ